MKTYIAAFSMLSMLFLISCSPKYYAPNHQDVPMLKNKGDYNIGFNGHSSQVSINAAYAINENYVVKGQGAFYFPPDDDNGSGGSGEIIEIGFGYYKALSEKILFEGYGLLGAGNMENHIFDNTGDEGNLSADLWRYGIQPAISYSHKNLEIAFSTRLAGIGYSRVRGDLEFDGIAQDDYLEENNLQFVAEPAITINAGFEQFKISGQIGYSQNLFGPEFPQDNVYIGLGLIYQKRNSGWVKIR